MEWPFNFGNDGFYSVINRCRRGSDCWCVVEGDGRAHRITFPYLYTQNEHFGERMLIDYFFVIQNLSLIIPILTKKKRLKLAIAESCTGGMLSSSIVSVSGSSKIFTMGLVTYSNQAKTSILKVPQKIIKKYGAVSVQCCLAMVNNLSKISKSKVCVSITGIAGPKGGSKQKPVGLVYIGISVGKKVVINKCNFKNKGRIFIQKQTVKKSLNLLTRLIKQDS